MNADISPAFQLIIVIISMASMTVGIMALRQSKHKTDIAFSGISHAGFMLMTLLNTTNCRNIIVLHFGLCISRNRCIQCNYICLKTMKTETWLFPRTRKTNPLLAAILLTASLYYGWYSILWFLC
jgi:NADH-quinone oxidoreductase subunit N